MKKTNTNTTTQSNVISEAVILEPAHDLKNAVLLVSLTVNLFFLVAWITLETISQVNGQTIASLLQ